ncbi:MAG: PilT/PilU family type 4a pilus ATPase [Planctomycetota bacterium]
MSDVQHNPNGDAGSKDPRRQLDELLGACVRLDASDLHICTDEPPYYRIHGVLEPSAEMEELERKDVMALADVLLDGYRRDALENSGSIDGAVTGADGARFRFNVYKQQGKLSIALRKLEDRFRTLSELGLPESLYRLSEMHDGLVVVAGPTGSGKSTTLATLIDRINQSRRTHIVTIEDPIEYMHRPALSLVNQRQIGLDASTFNDALVASLRQDPDVILVGEIRDLNTIRTAITASETGHLVFTTVHAGDCVGAIERLVSVFPADEQDGIRGQLALVLRAVVAQRLLVADGDGARAEADRERKRVVASEVLFSTPAVANLVTTGKSAQIYSTMESGAGQGMQTLEQDLARLWTGNVISERAAMAVARNPAIMQDRAKLMQRRGPATAGGRR